MLPKLVYPCTVLQVPVKVYDEVESVLFKFLWNWKNARIKKSVIIRNIEKGGLKMPDFRQKVKSWKSIWFKKAKYKHETPLWLKLCNTYLPSHVKLEHYFNSRPGKVVELKMCIPQFYYDLLIIWTDIKDLTSVSTFQDVISENIWNNKHVTIENKPINWPRWRKAGIVNIADLLNQQYEFKCQNQLQNDFNINITFLEAYQIRNAICQHWRKIIKEQIGGVTCDCIRGISLKLGKHCKPIHKVKTKDIYWLLINSVLENNKETIAETRWKQETGFPQIDFKKVYKIPFECTRYTYYQSFQYKIINRIFTCNYVLYKMHIKDSSKCTFCDDIDTILHYFADCKCSKNVWYRFKCWWNTLDFPPLAELDSIDIIFGFPRMAEKHCKILNLCIIIGKLSIYIDKSTGVEPSFISLLFRVRNHISIISKTGCVKMYDENLLKHVIEVLS